MATERGWQRELKTPGERLASLLGSPKFSDLELVFPSEHGSIMAHRVVLAMSSPVFEDLLYGSRAASRTLRIHEDHPEAFAWMLGYMYCNSKSFPGLSLAIEVSRLAAKYQMDTLAELCSQYLENNLNDKNLSEIYNVAVSLKNPSLLQGCSRIVSGRTSTVLLEPNFVRLSQDALLHLLQTTLYISSEVKIFRAVLTWSKHQIDRRGALFSEAALRREIEPLLPHIRFLSMSTDEFVSHIMPSGVLTSDESTAILLAIKESGSLHELPFICSNIKEKREIFDKSLIKRLPLPDMTEGGIISHTYSYEDHVLIANLKSSKTIHLHRVEYKALRISSMIATVRDPAKQVVGVYTSEGPTGVFERVIALHPGMLCSVTVSVVGRKKSALHRFTCNHDGVVFDGERMTLCESPIILHYWHFSE
ncbi:kelch-like ECH-associated protein 1 [Penaeus chinensis]|uniref:kelch-like ECH-associated protein 1 n=1 Tax=Penaeus chinensis TaxID=139456 RepID=UPI001FB7723E|nr:kelch-like ECH-associated protein 1 [Penaeus chinensis]